MLDFGHALEETKARHEYVSQGMATAQLLAQWGSVRLSAYRDRLLRGFGSTLVSVGLWLQQRYRLGANRLSLGTG